MKVILNNRLVPAYLKPSVERLVEDHLNRPKYLLMAYRDDPCDEVIVAIEPEDEVPGILTDLGRIRRNMEHHARELLNRNGVLNARNLTKPDARIWVKVPGRAENINGTDVDFSFGGNPVVTRPDGATPERFPGTLTCSGINEFAENSVRLITNQPLQDANGREVYQVDLDQSSVDSLRQDPADGKWTIRLPDRYRPSR